MTKSLSGKLLLTVLLAATAGVSVFVDARDHSHLFNDRWPPHAVFHDVALLAYLSLLCGVGVWLVWRNGPELGKDAALAALFCGGFWATFFVAAFFPGSSPAAHAGDPPPVAFLGTMGYPNMLIAAAAVPLSALGWWLAKPAHAPVTTYPPAAGSSRA